MEHFFKFKYDFIYHATDPNELYEQTFMEFNDSYTKVIARLDNITDEPEVFDPFIKKYKEFYQNFIELRVQEKMAYGIKTVLYTLSPLKNLETWPLIVYVISAILYLCISTIYHMMGNMSLSHKIILNKLNNGCVCLLLIGSCYPPYYYFFYCQINYKTFFLIIITLIGVILFFFYLTEEFNSADKSNLRGMTFLIFGVCSELPVFILTFILKDIRGHNNDAKFLYLYWGMLSYLLGGIIYLKRIPEKYFPGIFDYFGNSHQLLHILMLPAIFLNYFAFLDIYRSRFDCLC
jgi:channel protein (hemolysin III family)